MNSNFSLVSIDLSTILPVLLIAIVGLGLALYGYSIWRKKSNRISSRLEKFVQTENQPDKAPAQSQIVAREIRGSLFSRTIANWFNKFLNLIGRLTPQSMIDSMNHKLEVAGNPNNLKAINFFSIRLLVFFFGIMFAVIFIKILNVSGTFSLLFGIIVIGMSLFLPMAWLNGQIKNRQDEIRRGLPDALDMLSVCASAGLGFDQSLQKISSYWDTELGHELKRVIQEMEMGIPRSVALRSMSDRLEVSDLSQFIAIIIQTEKIGMSYAQVLYSQALQLRVLRAVRAREIANKLPAKMIIPLVVFIFPAIIAVIIGPTIPLIMNLF